MNSKGALLTLMVFFVGIIAVAMAINNANLQKGRESILPETTGQYSVNEQFEQLYYSVENMVQNEKGAQERSRALIFDYKIDGNALSLRQRMPVPESAFKRYYSFLNVASIFSTYWMQQSDINNSFSFEKIKSSAWGGPEEWPVLQYKILPQCAVYQLDYKGSNDAGGNKRVMVLAKGTMPENQCEFDRETGNPAKNFYPIRKIIVNVYSAGKPSGLGCGGSFYDSVDAANQYCWKKPFEETRGWPYAEFNFFVNGDLNFSVYNHFDPSSNGNTISFNLEGSPVQAKFGGDENIFRVDLSGIPAGVTAWAEAKITFAEPPQEFLLQDYSFIVEKPAFGIRRLVSKEDQGNFCENFSCDTASGETNANCPRDCTCPNGTCEPWENATICPQDCANDTNCSDGDSYPSATCCCSVNSGCNQNPATCDPGEDFGNCPADCSAMCGNGRCDSGETPENCRDDCHLCGNGQIETGEACDGTNLGAISKTCPEMGFAGGTMKCKSDCSGLDTGNCCNNECTVGSKRCDGRNVQVCSQGSSGCAAWNTQTCQVNYSCVNGECKRQSIPGGGGVGGGSVG